MDGYTAVSRGATLMRRYNNPARWVDGATVHTKLRSKMVIRVTEAEVRPGNSATAVVANIAAVQAWTRDVELLPQNATPDIMHMDTATYLVVPKQHWERVQQKLAEL